MARPAGSPRLVGFGEMRGVAGHAVADHLRVDVGAALEGVSKLLQHQHPAALAHHETVAAGVERPAGLLGLVVAGGECPQGREGRHAHLVHSRLGPAGEHGRRVAAPDQSEGIAQGVGAGRARRAGGVHRALEPQDHRTHGRGHVGDHHGDEEGADPSGALLVQHPGLLVESVEAAHPRTDQGPYGVRIFFDGIARVLQSDGRGRHPVLRVAVQPLGHLLVDEVGGRSPASRPAIFTG